MKTLLTIFASLFFCIGSVYAEEEKKVIPIDNEWEKTNDRDASSPQLYQSESSVYVYSEKQLDNVAIGITDMQGNTYHYEVTTVPACTHYAVSIDSLLSGQYYLCVYQGSNLDITSLLSSEELANISSTHEKY
ncbi:MAG: DUF3244 domain-containing protein [Bacteroidaceae bacterium]|nr:DUF3244 domain-containing protein [Bacteroidaceae bacterium]